MLQYSYLIVVFPFQDYSFYLIEVFLGIFYSLFTTFLFYLQAYASYMKGNLLFEQDQNWETALKNFKNARFIHVSITLDIDIIAAFFFFFFSIKRAPMSLHDN